MDLSSVKSSLDEIQDEEQESQSHSQPGSASQHRKKNSKDDDDFRQKRAEKRRRMQESLDAGVGDYLAPLDVTRLRHTSENASSETEELQRRIRQVSQSSEEMLGPGFERPQQYIAERRSLVNAFAQYCQQAEDNLLTMIPISKRGAERTALKQELEGVRNIKAAIKKERLALAANHARILLALQGQPDDVKISKAYLSSLAHHLPQPAGAQFDHPKSEKISSERDDFRQMCIKLYQPDGSNHNKKKAEYKPPLWCPVLEKNFPDPLVRAAHIIPQAVPQWDAAYLLGEPSHNGYSIIWGASNGLLLHIAIEKAYDKGKLAIVPHEHDQRELMTVILDHELRTSDEHSETIGMKWKSLHKKRMRFLNDVRPAKRNLYAHAVLMAFTRRRYNVPAWEDDHEMLFSGEIWATPGKWLRKSMLRLIAAEVGDVDKVEQVTGVEDFAEELPTGDAKNRAIIIAHNLEADIEDEDFQDEDDEEDDEADDGEEDERDDPSTGRLLQEPSIL